MFVSVCSSASSGVSTKYDPELLKSDVALARQRVSRLRRELEQIRAEMNSTQRGVRTLAELVFAILLFFLFNHSFIVLEIKMLIKL